MEITNTIKAIILVNLDGKQVLSKSYDDKLQLKEFVKRIFVKTKTQKTRDDISTVDGYIVIHRFVTDLHMYVVGAKNENPLILDRVLCCLVEVVTTLLNKNIERQSVLENLDQIILALDEICDGGTVLETDPDLVIHRVCRQNETSDQSMAQVLQNAKGHLRFPWIRS